MSKERYLVRTFGYFVLLGAAVFLVLFCANLRARLKNGAPSFAWLGYFGLYCAVIGFGLLRGHRWAVVLFSFTLFVSGLAIPIEAVLHSQQWNTAVAAVGCAVLLCWPAISALRTWNHLR